jgi:hypothetical protein
MSDFSGFFAAIERALFEVATWVFLIPKTLYLVLSHPSKVPEYVRGELSPREEGRARFRGTVSPLLLFLLVTLGPFLLIQLVQVPKAPIEGDPTGFVGSKSEFRANFEEIESAYWMKIIWSVEGMDSENRTWKPDPPLEPICFEGWQKTPCELDRSELAGEADSYPEPELLNEDALDAFMVLVESGKSADEARQVVTEDFGLSEAQDIFAYWCSWPPGPGCDPVHDRFFALVEEGESADEARRSLIDGGVGVAEAQEIYDYWCSAPPGRGCNPAYDRFDDLLADGSTNEEALAAITEEFGTEEAEAVSSLKAAFDEPDAEVIAQPAEFSGPGSLTLPPDFSGDVLTRTWEEPGRYNVSFEVRDINDELIDQSEVHEIVVNRMSPPAADAPARETKDRKGRSQHEESQRPQETEADRDPVNDFLQSSETAGLALAFLMFPLVLTLATELHRSRPLTQSTIKPAFYAQCLYLSPFVVSIWIPILLSQYHPEPVEEFGFALLLAAVIFIWLVIAEVGFVRGERSTSRFKAILWLAVPVSFVLISLIVVVFVAVQHKYAIVEWVGNIIMVLMLIPFIASVFVKLWRWATRKKIERPFHGGEW